MILDAVLFVISLVICSVIIYLLASTWFSNTHTKQVRSFVGFGLAVCLWTLFNAMVIISSGEKFVFVYSAHLVTGCIFPYVFFWYALNFSNSRAANSKPLAWVLTALALVECVTFATNPWHRLMLTSYTYPDLPVGPLYIAHALVGYILVLASLITIFRYIFRAENRTKSVMVAALSSLVPYVINILLMFDLLGTRRDLTPIAFFLTFTLFWLTSSRSGLLSLKSVALTNIFASLGDVIIIVDANGVIADYNAAYTRTFPEFNTLRDRTHISEFVGWISANIKEEQAALLPENLDVTSASYSVEFDVLPLTDNSGQPQRTFTLRCEPITHTQNNKVSGHVITISDVSAYRAMISEINTQNEHLVELNVLAEDASRAKSAFLANMSHEIRTPINAITGMAYIARNTNDLSRIHDCLDKVDTASRQLLAIINDILDISKIEADKMELAAEPFNLQATALNIHSIMTVRAAEKNQTLEVELSDDLPWVIGDDTRLSQILINLLSNAVKFTPDGGKISLSMRLLYTDNGIHALEAKVKDNGIGISEEQRSRLFHSFEQADRGTSKRYGGSGLGLVISKRLAEMMGGSITLESEVGAGSCFTVNFRLQAGHADMLVKKSENLNYDFSKVIALLAEDIAINREIVISMLERYGVQIEVAETGQDVVNMFVASPDRYDIIFMDIQMPVMDGYDATITIRQSGLPNASDVPILAMTANAFSEDVTRCRAVGMDDHIAKPIEIDLLLEKMSTLLSRRESD